MKNKFITAGITGFLFLVLGILVKTVDVAAIGPEGTRIGLSQINKAVHNFFGVNMVWYDITEGLGIFALVVVCVFAVVGIVQLVKRRSLWKVDKSILILGGLYVVVIGLYVLFEIFIVNYRPIIMPEAKQPEASFPSSHTMLICVVMGSTLMVLKSYLYNDTLRKVLQVLCAVIIVVTVCGRLICGVHWFTDIIGGILISVALLFLCAGIMEKVEKS